MTPPQKKEDWEGGFWSKVDRTGDCWIWKGTLVKPSRPYFLYRRKLVGASRFLYERRVGKVPKGRVLHRTCGNPLCVRPDHHVFKDNGRKYSAAARDRLFRSLVERTEDCWIWKGLVQHGRPVFKVGRAFTSARAYAYRQRRGPLPGGKVMYAYAACRNPRCVNPDHCTFGRRLTTPEQIRDRVDRDIRKTDDCWFWTGTLGAHGYGRISYNRKLVFVHRLVWELENGPIPRGMDVTRTCNHKLCVRPEHLKLVRKRERLKQTARYCAIYHMDKYARGEANHHAKLTQAEVDLIRDLYQYGGRTQTSLAEEFGVSPSHIGGIVKWRFWRGWPRRDPPGFRQADPESGR